MRINHNVTALNTLRQLGANTAATSKNIEKLSSGLRINRAGDDAAGLAISEKMRGQIRGLDMASRNGQDGISLIQTAEGALNESHSILQRVRELAVQSANDTNSTSDRNELQKEVSQLVSEIDRIASATEFNTKKLLNGGSSVAGTSSNTAVKINGGTADTIAGTLVTITAWTQATADNAATTATFATANTALSSQSDITINGVKFSFTTANTVQNVLDTINNAGVGVTAGYTTGSTMTFTAQSVGSASNMTVVGQTGQLAGGAVVQGVDATVTITGTPTYIAEGNKITLQTSAAKGLEFSVSGATGTANLTITSNGGVNMQIGANEGQSMYVGISDMRAAALGISGVDISTQAGAKSAITTVDNAVSTVSSERSKLGAYQNRLEHTINNLNTSSENLTAAESRIRDVDMAKEMMEQTKNSILAQAAQAMLAQANQQPQGVLQLLR